VHQLLSREDIIVNSYNEAGATPLHTAACNDYDDDIVELLLDNGAEVNCLDSNGETALIKAVAKQNRWVVTVLLQHSDIDVNCKDKSGKPLLNIAVEGKRDDRTNERIFEIEIFTQLLARKDIDVNCQDSGYIIDLHPMSSLDLVIGGGNLNMLSLLFSVEEVDDTRQGNTPLHTAIDFDEQIAIQLLNDSRVNLIVENGQGKTSIDRAKEREQTALKNKLLREHVKRQYNLPTVEHAEGWLKLSNGKKSLSSAQLWIGKWVSREEPKEDSFARRFKALPPELRDIIDNVLLESMGVSLDCKFIFRTAFSKPNTEEISTVATCSV
jgi:ankyrin repeat protein